MFRSLTKTPHALSALAFLLTGLTIGALELRRSTMPSDVSPQQTWATTVELRDLKPGIPISVPFNGTPVFVLKLSAIQLEEARTLRVSDLIDQKARNRNLPPTVHATLENRTFQANDTFVVVEGRCDSFGYVPIFGMGDFNAWFCPRGGEHFDILGRFHRGANAQNLPVPRYHVIDGERLVLVDWEDSISEKQLDRTLYGSSQ